MKKFLTAVSSAVLVLSSVSSVMFTATAENSENSPKVKIMPVGDSITDGYWEQGGYRKYLSYTLTQNGFDFVDFVGPKGADSETFDYNGEQVSYDGNYAGYSGYAIQYMTGTETRQGILETLQDGDYIKTYAPDIVLLQIGTNDVLSAYNDGITDRLENLITYILDETDNSESVVYVSTIPDIDVVTVESWLWAYGDAKWNNTLEDFTEIVQGYVDSYNASIPVLVEKMQSEGKNVQFADIHSVVDMTTDLYDGVHPNESGYEKMGLYWAGLLSERFTGTSGDTTTTTTTTTTATTTAETTSSAAATTETTATETTAVTTVTEQPTEETTETVTTTSENPEKEYFTVADLVSLANYVLGRTNHGITAEKALSYDLTGDGRLTSADVSKMRQIYLEPETAYMIPNPNL